MFEHHRLRVGCAASVRQIAVIPPAPNTAVIPLEKA